MTANGCSAVAAVVTGMEHSGTTALAQLILSRCTGVAGGFECGVLLSEHSPADFVDVQPFHKWFLAPTGIGHWGMSADDLAHACAADDWCGFYQRVIERCPLFEAGDLLLDKTPAYSYELPRTLERLGGVPVLVTVKDLILLYRSYKQRDVALAAFVARVERFLASFEAAGGSERVVVVRHRDLCLQPDRILESVVSRFPTTVAADRAGEVNWSLRPLSRDYDVETEIEQANDDLTAEERRVLEPLSASYERLIAAGVSG